MTDSTVSLVNQTMNNTNVSLSNQTLNTTQILPLLCIFNIDCVLWPFWMNSELEPPFVKLDNGTIFDLYDKVITYYPEVPAVLDKLKNNSIKIAVVDLCWKPDEFIHLFKLLDWYKYFTYIELYNRTEKDTIMELQEKSKIPYNQTIFFNIHKHIGEVYSDLDFLPMHVYFEDGMTMKILDNALKKYKLKALNITEDNDYDY